MWQSLLLLAALSGLDLAPPPPGSAPETILVDLPGGARVLGVRERAAALGPERWVWTGHLAGEPESSLVLSRVDGVVRGALRSDRGELRVTGEGWTEVRASPISARAQEDRAPLVPPVVPATPAADSGAADGPIDLLVVVTPRAQAEAGSAREMDALVQLGVAEANLALERSGVGARLRLVELRQVDYLESGRVESDLEILRHPGDGALDEVQEMREAFGADLVQLVVAEQDGCGIAYLLPAGSPALEGWGYSVVEWSCVDGALALAHEIGHSLGCDHAPGDPTSGGAFDFSHGYRDPLDRFRTVMAYGPAPRVARFSSPKRPLGGLPTGAPDQDNARTIARLWPGVASFRRPLEPPRLALASGIAISGGAAELRLVLPSRRDREYWVVAGTAPGARDLFDSGRFVEPRGLRLTGLPTDGRPAFVRLFYRPGRVWLHEDLRVATRP